MCVFTGQYALNTGDHVIDIVFACAQVGVVHFVKDGGQCVALRFQGPFRVALTFANQFHRCRRQHAVFEHQQVRINKVGDVGAGGFRNTVANCLELLACGANRPPETGNLVFDEILRNRGFENLDFPAFQPVYLADGDAA